MAGIWNIVASIDPEQQERIDVQLLRTTLTAVGLNVIEYAAGRGYLETSLGRPLTTEETDDLINLLTNQFTGTPDAVLTAAGKAEFVFKLAELGMTDEATFRLMLGM